MFVLSDQTVESTADEDNTDATEEPVKRMIGTKDEFRILFKEKRRQQISAVKTLQSFGKYEQKYSMVSNIFDKLFEVQQKAKQSIENSSYVLGSELPKEGQLLDSLSNIIENCAFFGDIVLRLPDISHRVLRADQNRKFESLYKWCISFSLATDLCDKSTTKMFDLLAQELALVPKNESYVNPYKKSNKKVKFDMNADVVQSSDHPNHQNQKNDKRKQKAIRRGPRLSRSRSSEL